MAQPKSDSASVAFEGAFFLISIVAYALLFAYKSLLSAPELAIVVYDLVGGLGILFALVLVLDIYGRITKNKDAAKEIINVVRLFGYPILVIFILNSLGVNVTSLLVGAGFLGIIIGLAAQTTLGNLFAGFAILYSRPFRVGEKISVTTPQYSLQSPSYPHEKLEVEVTGTVKSIGIMHTRILRNDATIVYIPNSVINLGLIINYSRAEDRSVVLRSEIDRKIDVTRVKRAVEKAFAAREFRDVKNITVTTANVTTKSDVGIVVTGRVLQADYERLREAMAQTFVQALRKAEKS